MGRTACRVAATPARASCIVSYRNRNLTSIGVRVLHALRRQPIRTCLRNSASSPLSGRFFEKDFMILPFPLTASLAFFLRGAWLCWGKWLPLFYLRFFVASGGGRGPSWPPCRGRKKTLERRPGTPWHGRRGRQISRSRPLSHLRIAEMLGFGLAVISSPWQLDIRCLMSSLYSSNIVNTHVHPPSQNNTKTK